DNQQNQTCQQWNGLPLAPEPILSSVRCFDDKTAPKRVKIRKDGAAGTSTVTPAAEKAPGAQSSREQQREPNVPETKARDVRTSSRDWVCDCDRKAKKK